MTHLTCSTRMSSFWGVAFSPVLGLGMGIPSEVLLALETRITVGERPKVVRLLFLLPPRCFYPPGGLVVYSTCSMNPVEDEAVVLSCLRGRAEFTLVDVSSKLEGLWWSSGVQDWTVTDSRGATYSSWQEVCWRESHVVQAY